MDSLDRDRTPDPFRRALTGIRRRWRLVVAIVALVAVGVALKELPLIGSPQYVDVATIEIMAAPSAPTGYGDYVARLSAETAEETVANELIPSLSFAAALADRLQASGMDADVSSLQGALGVAHSGDQVSITVHWATKSGAEHVMGAALAEISAEVAAGNVAATGSQSGDAQLRMVATSAETGAAVDQSAQQAVWRVIALRLLVAFGAGVVLVGAASLWGDRRRRGVEVGASAEAPSPAGESE